MKKSYILIAAGILGAVLGVILFFYSENYFNLLGGLIGIVSMILGFYWRREDQRTAQLNLEESRGQHIKIKELPK